MHILKALAGQVIIPPAVVRSSYVVRGQSKKSCLSQATFLFRGPGFRFAMRNARAASICFWKYSASVGWAERDVKPIS